MAKFVASTFATRSEAGAAVERLLIAGVDRFQVSVLISEHTRGGADRPSMQSGTGTGRWSSTNSLGALVGGGLGAALASVAAAGTLAVPGLGLVAVGRIIASIGDGRGRSVGDTVRAALEELGVGEPDAERLAAEVERGQVLVGVHAEEGADAARLERALRGWSGAGPRKDRDDGEGLGRAPRRKGDG